MNRLQYEYNRHLDHMRGLVADKDMDIETALDTLDGYDLIECAYVLTERYGADTVAQYLTT
jgi:hypothetical protein